MRRVHTALATLLGSVLVALAASACGYRSGYTPPGGSSVGVAFFENVSKERDLDRDFHLPLTDSVQRIVRAPLVAPDRARYRIDGRMLDFRRRNGIRSANNSLLETGVRITVEARLERRNPDTGELEVLRRIEVQDERGYVQGDVGGEAGARARALRNLADRVVIDLFADLAWEAP
ncbi:MAG: hypothetical protein FJ298_06700 [Planctomycetes bacterium]|nr:hypothetical protein [Planctomycetota bacterium]